MEIFLLWLVCVVGGTGFAASRNMPISGFLACFLFGPIGLVAVLLSDKRVKCPACLGRLPVGKPSICGRCHAPLAWDSKGVHRRGEENDQRRLDPVPEYYFPPFLESRAPYDPTPEEMGLPPANRPRKKASGDRDPFDPIPKDFRLPPAPPPPT